jgi:phosphomannomutase
VCFYGDGDRIIFIDETGQPVGADRITALLGLYFFKHHPDKIHEQAKVLCDIRSSKSVADYLRSMGAVVLPCPIGQALIKAMLRRERGLHAGELGELSFTVDDTEGIIKEVRQAYREVSAAEISGLRIDFDD